jgi:two-component system, chemotaxis family, protein-glutamate methylesterase/glutaminase
VPGHDIIVVGASAGGVEALRTLAKGLPADLPAALFAVLHMPPDSRSVLPQILTRAGRLPAREAKDGDLIEPGRIYLPVPDHHLLVDAKRVRVVRGPKENHYRPSVDALFRSAARSHGPRVIGVVLSGALDDGAAGALAIKQRGGLVVVQDPGDAVFPDMPRAALDVAEAEHRVPVARMAALLADLSHRPAPPDAAFPVPAQIEIEDRIAHMEKSDVQLVGKLGEPSAFSCPECHGVMWEMKDPSMLRFRCQVGHAFSAESMVAHQWEDLEDTLWAAVRSLNENASLARRLQTNLAQQKRDRLADRFRRRAEHAETHSGRLRHLLEVMRDGAMPGDEAEPEETA